MYSYFPMLNFFSPTFSSFWWRRWIHQSCLKINILTMTCQGEMKWLTAMRLKLRKWSQPLRHIKILWLRLYRGSGWEFNTNQEFQTAWHSCCSLPALCLCGTLARSLISGLWSAPGLHQLQDPGDIIHLLCVWLFCKKENMLVNSELTRFKLDNVLNTC